MKTNIMNKKTIIAAGILAVFLLIGTGAYLYLKTPVHLLAIDVNPSIELRTDRLNRVVSVNPVNEDAVDLMAGYQLDDRNLETVIGDIVDRMIFYGYLTSDQKNQILITADDTYTSAAVLDKVNTAIEDYMSERQLEVEILQQQLAADNNEVDTAHSNNVSFGKMAIINELTADGSGLTADELTGLSIRDLVAYAVSQGISLEDLINNYNDVLAEQTDTASADVDAVSSATTKETGSGTVDIISKAAEDAIEAEDALGVSMEDVENENEDSIKAADSDENSDEDADDDDQKDESRTEHKKSSGKNHESAYQASESDADDEDSDSEYEDASDDDNGYDVEDSDQDEDGSDHEDAYYEDSEDNDYDGQEDGNSYYEEDQNDEDSNWDKDRYSDDQGGDNDRDNGEDDNQQGDED